MMTRLKSRGAAACTIAALVIVATPASAADNPQVAPGTAAPDASPALVLDEAQKAAWQGEVDYWKHVNARDLPAYLKLWHPNFTGWPCGAGSPADLSGLGKMAAQWFTDMEKAGQATVPKAEAVIVDDGFAITYLSAQTTWTDPAGAKRSKLEKFVHTWKSTDDGWKIIGGMCAPLDTYPTAEQK